MALVIDPTMSQLHGSVGTKILQLIIPGKIIQPIPAQGTSHYYI